MMWPLILIGLLASVAGKKDYTGYHLITLESELSQHGRLIQSLREHYDFWSPKSFIVSPGQVSRVEGLLRGGKLSFSSRDDVQSHLDELEALTALARQNRSSTMHDWTTYSTWDELNEWMDIVAADFDWVIPLNVGYSYENREMRVLVINPGAASKQIWIDGGIHAREWISPAFVTYVINELTYNYENNKELADAFEWYIMPVANPDGYVYSWEEDRFWRKTRSEYSAGCRGVDPNRNFDFHWNEAGSSNNPCSEIYAGPEAFSEAETAAMRDIMMSLTNGVLYNAIHSYGQLLVSPWSYTFERPDDFDRLEEIANAVCDAITSVYGTYYYFGQSTDIFGATSGSSDDWAKGVAGIAISYTWELRPDGFPGFDLPPSEILATCEETFEGIKAAASFFQ